MSLDIYIKIAGVDGESSDSTHQGWIEIQNISTGISLPFSNTSYSSTGGGTNTGRADFDYITFTKFMDNASVKLQEYCATGKTCATVEIHFCQAGDGQEKHSYMTYKLKDAVISRYSVSASQHDTTRPMESISLAYGNIELGYKKLEDAGSAGAEVKFEYSLKENKKV
jgi:type VI secretion system secreted protein Hcp